MQKHVPKWITDLALDVYKLVRKHDAMSRFREVLESWARDQEAAITKHKEWVERRARHFEDTARGDQRLANHDAGPPAEDWEWECYLTPIHKKTQKGWSLRLVDIEGWVPRELGYQAEPQIPSPLPLTSERELSVTEKYVCLAAAYEMGRKGTERMALWPWPGLDDWGKEGALSDAKKSLYFEVLCQSLSEMEEGEDEWLKLLLDDVTKDIANWRCLLGRSGTSQIAEPKGRHGVGSLDAKPKGGDQSVEEGGSISETTNVPSRERLTAIVKAARGLIHAAHETYCVAGQQDPPGFPTLSRVAEMVECISNLENQLNPRHVPFGHNGRKSVGVSGWHDMHRLERALVWLGNLHDTVLQAWHLEALCEGKALSVLTKGGKHADSHAPGVVRITVGMNWPPKIERTILESMAKAATWIQGVLMGPMDGIAGGPRTPSDSKPLAAEMFCAYSHEDEELRDQLHNHLAALERNGDIIGWYDRKVTAGKDWKGEIDQHIDSATIILLLISSDFLSSDYCYNVETKRAMRRHCEGAARVIPVILRPCVWQGTLVGQRSTRLGDLEALPKDGRAVTSWPNHDEAFTSIAEGIKAALDEITLDG